MAVMNAEDANKMLSIVGDKILKLQQQISELHDIVGRQDFRLRQLEGITDD